LTKPTPYDIIQILQERKERLIMDYELIWWCIVGGLAVLFMIGAFLPWNDRYDPKGDDPYRYCPKEDEE
jgi:hypothetical protein